MPKRRTVYWYGLSAGLTPGIMWAIMYMVNFSDPFPLTMNPLMRLVLGWGPSVGLFVLVVATGARLGWHNGSVRDGLVAGAIAGWVFTIAGWVFAIVYLLTVPGFPVITIAHATYSGMAWLIVITGIVDLVNSLIGAAIGAALGAIGALAGRTWSRRRQPTWSQSAGIVTSRLSQ